MSIIAFNFLFSTKLTDGYFEHMLDGASEATFQHDPLFTYEPTGSFLRKEGKDWILCMRASTVADSKACDALLEGATDDIFGNDPDLMNGSGLLSTWWEEITEEDKDTNE